MTSIVIPAKAGIPDRGVADLGNETPASAGVTECDPCAC